MITDFKVSKRKEYIEREKALLEIEEWADTFCECDYVWPHVIKSIKKLPAADVRPVVRGKWIMNDECRTVCSLCGNVVAFVSHADKRWEFGNFCPNCGADMREQPKEEEL